MKILITFAMATLLMGSGCIQSRLDVRLSGDRHEVLTSHARFLEEPSTEHLLDLLVNCSETDVDVEALWTLCGHLRIPDCEVATIGDVVYTDHDISAACLCAMTGYEFDYNELIVKAIVSRRINGVPYRYHIYATTPDFSKRMDQIVSAWIDGFMAGRRVRESE